MGTRHVLLCCGGLLVRCVWWVLLARGVEGMAGLGVHAVGGGVGVLGTIGGLRGGSVAAMGHETVDRGETVEVGDQ